jgi:hypothetical protein
VECGAAALCAGGGGASARRRPLGCGARSWMSDGSTAAQGRRRGVWRGGLVHRRWRSMRPAPGERAALLREGATTSRRAATRGGQ